MSSAATREMIFFFLFALGLLAVFTRQGLLLTLIVIIFFAEGLSLLWRKYALVGLTYERRLEKDRLFPGDEVDLWVTVTNRKPLPLPWLVYADEIHRDLWITRGRAGAHYKPQRQSLLGGLSLRWYERVTRRYRLKAQRRGYFVLGPVAVQVEDFFGLSAMNAELPGTDVLLVYPRLYSLEELGLQPQAPFGERRGGERIFEDPSLMMGTREYTPDDPFNRVDWKATARSLQLQVRVFEPSVTTAVALFLNVNTFRYAWEGVDEERLEWAISLTASLAQAAHSLGYLVGVYANGPVPGRSTSLRLPPRQNPEQMALIMEGLAMVSGPGFVPIEGLLDQSRAELGWGTVVVVITPYLGPTLRSALLELKAAGHPVRVFLLSDEETGETELEIVRPRRRLVAAPDKLINIDKR